jgi:hypothetical protein
MAIYSISDCSEEHDAGHGESWDVDRWDATVQLRCTWANRHALVADLLGNQRPWPHSGFATTPLAATASIEPVPTQYVTVGQSCTYIEAIVTVGYSSDEEEDLLAESLEPTAEFMTLDHKLFKWDNGDPLVEGEAPGKVTRSLSIVRQMFKLASIPSEVRTCIGKSNDVEYVSALLGMTFPAETLVYEPSPMNRTITTAGDKGWNVALKFNYKPEGWNKFWRTKTQDWHRFIVAATGAQYDNYEPDDFSNILF